MEMNEILHHRELGHLYFASHRALQRYMAKLPSSITGSDVYKDESHKEHEKMSGKGGDARPWAREEEGEN
jgi:hypothetical protein